jgi:hypothetical protein
MANEFDLFTAAPTGASVSPKQDEFSSFVSAAPAAPQPVAPTPVEKPAEDLTKPAFLAPRQRATALTERAAKIREEEAQKIPFDALWKDDNNYKLIQEYALARFGKEEGTPRKGETKEDFINRFATHMRRVDSNPIDSYQELGYLNNAKPDAVLKAGAVYDLFKNTAGVFDEQNRGQKGMAPLVDFVTNIISDPGTMFTMGAGKFVATPLTKMVAEKGTKAALLSARGSAVASAAPAVGFTSGATQNVQSQKIDLDVLQAQLDESKAIDPKTLSPEGQQKLQERIKLLDQRIKEGVSTSQAVLAGTLNAAGEVIGVLPFIKGKGNKSLRLDDVLKNKAASTVEKQTAAPTVEVKAADPTMKALEDSFDIFEGRKLLDDQGKPTSVAQMEVRNDLNKKATLIAQDIWKQIPEFAPQKTEKVSDAIKRTLESVDTFDDVVFERALASADVTPDEFAKMFRTSVGDAARSLQSLSVVARLQNKLKNIDPAAAAELNKMYGDRSAITSAFSGIKDFGMRIDRELKALMVSQLSTTIRNAFSGMAVVTFGTASETIESALYRMGKTAGELATGKPVTGSFTGGLKGVYDDAVRSAFYLGQKDLSADVTEALLQSTPSLYRKMVKTAGEAGTNELSQAAQIANTLNVAQDSFFRKAMFTASVEKQLSRVGINMYDVLAQGKQVPFDVLQNAVNEALTGTFSKMPTKGPMFHAVKFVEELGPIGSTVIPFPRFMANAMEWTYKHMPTGALSGSTDIAAGLTKLAKGETDMGTKQLTLGLENFSKGTVGTAAVYAAYKYRQDHQDTEWYNIKNPDGSTVDTRALFPAAPFLALGDYLVKFQNGRTDEFKSKEFLEAMTGLKAPAGTYSWLGDKFAEAQTNAQTGENTAENKVRTFFGEWAGEYFGRALVPFQQISDIIGAIDRNETLPRDAYQIPAGEEGFKSSAINQLMKRTPVLKQELPVYQPPLREKAVFNENGPLKMFTGIAIKAVPSALEAEVTRLKIPGEKIFSTTGDKVVDADARKIMAPLVVEQFDNLKKTSFYQDASQDMQKIALQNLISWAGSTAKEIASDKSTAAAYKEGKQPRLYEVQYSKLPPELKRVVVQTYKEQQGKDLETTKDYASALAIAAAMRDLPGYAAGGDVKPLGRASLYDTQMKKMTSAKIKALTGDFQETYGRPLNPETDYRELIDLARKTNVIGSGYAVGGVVHMDLGGLAAKKIAGEVAETALKKSIMPLSEIVSKYSVAPAIEQTAKALVKPEVAAVKEGAATAIAKTPYIKNKYGPSVSKPVEEVAPVVKQVEETAPVAKQMEEALPETSVAPKVEEPLPEINTALPTEEPSIYTTPIASTNLNKPGFGGPTKEMNADGISNAEVRKNTLSSIKVMRQEAFDTIKDSPMFEGIEKDAIAVAQGDYRIKTGKEFNPDNPADVESFAKFAEGYQKKLDDLREQYKDAPPKILIHGSITERTPAKVKRGFFDPQTLGGDKTHMELDVGATSFTGDIRLNYRDPAFGGKVPENISYTEIPYADYLFRRVDLPIDAYYKKDMNIIAQTITGDPTIARPMGLPRNLGYRETEDAFVESEKLKMNTDFDKVRKQYASLGLQEKVTSHLDNKLFELANKVDKDGLNLIENIKQGTEKTKDVYETYNTVKNLFKNEFRHTGGKAATKAGWLPVTDSNQSIISGLNTRASTRNVNIIDNLAVSLERSGATDKALALQELSNNLKTLQTIPRSRERGMSDQDVVDLIKKQTKAANNIRDLIGNDFKIVDPNNPKNTKRIGLAKGGLASRRTV